MTTPSRPGQRPRPRLHVVLPLVILLGSCAPAQQKPINWWPAERLAQTTQSPVVLETPDHRQAARLDRERLKNMVAVKERIEAVAGIKTTFIFMEGESPNAFAWTEKDGRNVVSFNLPMLEFIQKDMDAFAFVYGHEVGHNLKHHGSNRQDMGAGIFVLKQLAGIGLSVLGVPLGGTVADLGISTVERKFDRDQEREADDIGMELMFKAGFDPTGGVRFQERLTATKGDSWLPFLSTHPSGEERINRLRYLAAQYQAGKPRD